MVDREAADDAILRGVGVLVFIDEDPAVPRIEDRPQVGVVGEQPGDMHEQVVEVHRVGVEQHLLVDGPEPPGHFIGRASPARLEGFRGEQVVLRPADGAREAVDRRVREREAELLRGSLEDCAGVVGIEDRVVAGEADEAGVPPQEAGGEAVEGAHLDRLGADELRDAAAHLVGGLVGEREGDDL